MLAPFTLKLYDHRSGLSGPTVTDQTPCSSFTMGVSVRFALPGQFPFTVTRVASGAVRWKVTRPFTNMFPNGSGFQISEDDGTECGDRNAYQSKPGNARAWLGVLHQEDAD
jgi:hypothetical protein